MKNGTVWLFVRLMWYHFVTWPVVQFAKLLLCFVAHFKNKRQTRATGPEQLNELLTQTPSWHHAVPRDDSLSQWGNFGRTWAPADNFYKDPKVIFIVFDLSRKSSFKLVPHAMMIGMPLSVNTTLDEHARIILVGNKKNDSMIYKNKFPTKKLIVLWKNII